jgi:hypothetical protein
MPDTDPVFDEAIREAGRRIGEIITEDNARQRREIHAKIRAMLETAAGIRPGGELAEALLQVLLVTDGWMAASPAPRWIMAHNAADEILTAMETGLGVR